MKPLIPVLMLLVVATPADARIIQAGASWTALDRSGRSCEAISRSLRIARDPAGQAHASISFDRGPSRRNGELHLALSRPVRPGFSVLLTIGDQPFMLVASGRDAWSRGPVQEASIIAAMRRETGMRASVRDSAGRGFTDRYLLAGAPTAIDAAAAACVA